MGSPAGARLSASLTGSSAETKTIGTIRSPARRRCGLDWQLGGFAAAPPTGSMGSSDSSTSQLVQAMAGFDGGSGAGESLNIAPVSAETSQQTLLTTPQHA